MTILPRYSDIEELQLRGGAEPLFFNERLLVQPIRLSSEELQRRQSTYAAVTELFSSARDIFRRCVLSDSTPTLTSLLLNDSLNRVPRSFYDTLPQEVWTDPLFFRTDESRSGQIFEIQCPGSGWGDLLLLASLYGENYSPAVNPQTAITEAIQRTCRSESPAVLHLLDNSSTPGSMRYFIRRTQPPLRYWGYAQDLRSSQCELIRSHSVYGLLAENLFGERLRLATEGKVTFDLPPLLIFDQKMILCLPFLDNTRDAFSDKVRACLSYTYPLSPDGFRNDEGEWLTIDEFLSQPPHLRKWFLKYGGCDTNINWGSRGVHRLDKSNAHELLKKASDDYSKGRPWVIQPDVSDKEDVEYLERGATESVWKRMTARYSTFYGPSGLIGVRTHHRLHPKVHGQPDAVVGLAF